MDNLQFPSAGSPAEPDPVTRSFEIEPGPGTAWTLKLFENDVPAGGGQFREDEYDEAVEQGQSWCQAAEPCDEPAKGEQAQDAVGVDMPGVGLVRPGGLSGEFPASLRRYVDSEGGQHFVLQLSAADLADLNQFDHEEHDRQALIIQLIYAARDLAAENILHRDFIPVPDGGLGVMPGWCRECQMTEQGGSLTHTDSCRTGRVFAVLAELLALPNRGNELLTFDLKRKEDAPGEMEEAGAGDGIRPRGLRAALERSLIEERIATDILGGLEKGGAA